MSIRFAENPQKIALYMDSQGESVDMDMFVGFSLCGKPTKN
jgi:hypothetical protein